MNLKSSNKTDVNMTELVVEIDAESFEKAVEAAYQRQKKNISMPGFRKGKVPRKMCERTYGENVFYEDAINALLNMELPALIVDNKLNVVDTPKVEVTAVSKEDGVTMKVICVTKPEISLEGYKGIEAPKVVKEIADEDVDQQIESMRQRNARVVSVDDRAAEMGDEVNLNFEGFFGDEAFDGGKGENYQLKLGSGQFIPGFEELMVGMTIGEEKDLNVTFPTEYHAEELAGKEAVFHVKVNGITETQLPALDDDFAKDISEFDTLDAYKADVRAKLEAQTAERDNNVFTNAVIGKVMENATVEIPEAMIERQIDSMIRNFEARLAQQGLKLADFMKYTGQDEKSFRGQYRDQAEKSVRANLVLEAIENAENFEVSDEEIDAEIEKFAKQIGQSVEELKKNLTEGDREYFKADVIRDKAVKFLCDNAKAE